MNINRFFKQCLGVIISGSILFACTKMADSYDNFIANGEIYYPGKADSLKTYPGRNRIELSWLLVSDPKITKSVMYWNNKADSVVIPVTRSRGVDTIRKLLTSIAEGTYTFEVYTYDDKGNRSVKVDAIANVYGNNYDISLVNRPLKTAVMSSKLDTAKLVWYPTSLQHVGINIRYKNTVGDSIFLFVPGESINTNLLKFKKGEAFIYRSLYKPEANAIDTFYTKFESKTVN